MHLTYTSGGKYANAARSYRENGKVKKVYIHLGKVVDKDRGIYDHKEIGLVGFDLEKGEFVRVDTADATHPLVEEKLILDFGDAYFLDWYIREKGFMRCIEAIDVPQLDTLRSLIIYYLVSGETIDHALEWYSGSYASILYPDANMDGHRILEYFYQMGQEYNYRNFFKAYIPIVTGDKESVNVIIDSFRLPNDVHMPIMPLSHYNCDINNEIRVIVVMDKDQGMPIFIRYVSGNIVDSTTLIHTIRELEQQGVGCAYALLDIGYPFEKNLYNMCDLNINFIFRLDSGSDLYKGLHEEVLPKIMFRENFTMFGDRSIYIRKVRCDLAQGFPGYAYCVLEIDRKNIENSKLTKKAVKNNFTDGETFNTMVTTDFFVLISNMDLENSEVLPNYYVRQFIEQFLDVCKGSAALLPLPVHTEDTFRGHLLVSFIAAAVAQSLQNDLTKLEKVKKQNPEKRIGSKSLNMIAALMNLRNQKCKVYDNVILPKEPQSKGDEIYKLFNLKSPYAIPKHRCSHKKS